MDLDFGVALCSYPLFFLLNPSIALVALVGFRSEGLDHLVCSCLLHLLHRIVLSTKFRGIEVEKLVTLRCIVFPRACASWVHCVP